MLDVVEIVEEVALSVLLRAIGVVVDERGKHTIVSEYGVGFRGRASEVGHDDHAGRDGNLVQVESPGLGVDFKHRHNALLDD